MKHLRGGDWITPNVSTTKDKHQVYYNKHIKNITFYIDGYEYEVNEGTTWGDFLSDEKNVSLITKNTYPIYYNDSIEHGYDFLVELTFFENNYNEIFCSSSESGEENFLTTKNNLNTKLLISDEIIESENYIIFGDMPFTFDGIERKCISGMTWYEWLNWRCIPPFSTCDVCWSCVGDENPIITGLAMDDTCLGIGMQYGADNNGVRLKGSDIIIENSDYHVEFEYWQ